MQKPHSFLDAEINHRIPHENDSLYKISKFVDFEIFRKPIEETLFREKYTKGRPSFDVILMVKILILEALYNLSDDAMEYQILDKLSFVRFLGLSISDKVPDTKTIWHYREKFRENGIFENVFRIFLEMLEERGYSAKSGQIIDASIIEAPKQRNIKEEKEKIKQGEIPEEWSQNKFAQKDKDARWVVQYKKSKGQEVDKMPGIATPKFDYKNHISIDKKYKFIRKSLVTPANAYDGHYLEDLLDYSNLNPEVWGDKSYGTEHNFKLAVKLGFKPKMHKLGQTSDVFKSQIRASVKHVFTIQKNIMQLFIRTIGIKRANAKIALANLAYNIKRFVYLQSRQLIEV